MSKCFNHKCNNEVLQSPDRIYINCDGDAVCCKKCEAEYIKQRDHFFNVIVQSEDLTRRFLQGEDV